MIFRGSLSSGGGLAPEAIDLALSNKEEKNIPCKLHQIHRIEGSRQRSSSRC